jgi:hypothetical protein
MTAKFQFQEKHYRRLSQGVEILSSEMLEVAGIVKNKETFKEIGVRGSFGPGRGQQTID